jgi:hypothetical protein
MDNRQDKIINVQGVIARVDTPAFVGKSKALRYLKQVREVEDQISENLPSLLLRLLQIAQHGSNDEALKAVTYLMDRVMGKAQRQQVAPSEDLSPPIEERSIKDVSQIIRQMLSRLPDHRLRQVESILVEALQEVGELPGS